MKEQNKKQTDIVLLTKPCMETLMVHGNTLISVNSFCERIRALWNKNNKTHISKYKMKLWLNNPQAILDEKKLCDFFKENIESVIGKKIDLKFYGATDSNTVDCFIINVIK